MKLPLWPELPQGQEGKLAAIYGDWEGSAPSAGGGPTVSGPAEGVSVWGTGWSAEGEGSTSPATGGR